MRSQTAILNDRDFTNTFTNEYDNPINQLTIITPTTGKKLVIIGVYISTEATSGTIRLRFNTSANLVAKIYPSAGITVSGYIPLFVEGNVDEVLSMTATTASDENYYIIVNYKEV